MRLRECLFRNSIPKAAFPQQCGYLVPLLIDNGALQQKTGEKFFRVRLFFGMLSGLLENGKMKPATVFASFIHRGISLTGSFVRPQPSSPPSLLLLLS
jgi:hypothetical protein